MAAEQPVQPNRHKLDLSLDLRFIIIVLLAVIALMLFLWKPWDTAGTGDRTVQVTGETTLTAEPDEFIFYPAYSFRDADADAALAALGRKSDTVVAELKKLGVPDSKIKTDSDGYQRGGFAPEEPSNGNTYTLRMTVTVDNRELAQKVQDYLLSTEPSGAVTPQATFSDAKRKELESKARDEATKDARAKAEQSANNLGYRLGDVKSVSDVTFGSLIPYDRGVSSDSAESAKLVLQPGENELRYSVSVTYYIR